jgi:two-component system sensor histidine kinase HydH
VNEDNLQSTLIGWIILLAITISVLLRRNRDTRQRLFVLFAGNVTLYYFFAFLSVWKGEPLYERLALGVAILIPQGGLRFFRAFSTGARGMGRLGGVAALLGLLLLALVFYPTSIRPMAGLFVLAYAIGFMLVAILNLNAQAKVAPTRVDEARIRYLVVGGLLALAFQIVDRLDVVYDVDPPPLGLVMTAIYLYVISQTIMRYRILDLYETMGRFTVLSLMGVALAAIYTALVFWAGAGPGFSINAFLASLVILILFDPLHDLVERKIADFFFRERDILDQDVNAIRRRLTHVIDVGVMTDVLLEGFQNSRRSTHAAVYLIDPHRRGFDLRGSIGRTPEMTRIEIATARISLMPYATGGALTASTLAQRQERLLQEGKSENAQAVGEARQLLASVQADVLLPIQGDDELLGFLSLRDERLTDPFTPEEVDRLSGLTSQMAVTVENSRLYQQTKERDRLAALGQMSAGLAHEIRNPLGSIKAAAQFIDEIAQPRAGSEAEGEMLAVIVEEVDRLNRVVSDFLNYARPTPGIPQRLDINQVLRRALQVFETGQESKVDLVLDLMDDLPGVKADAERLHQVFLNLVINAVQAMRDQDHKRLDVSSRVRSTWARTERRAELAKNSFIEIRFADSGPGIESGTLENIFIPFFTTKEHGSGLGLALCQRIVRDAGGEIEVMTEPGKGSTFIVVLPTHDREAGSGDSQD